MAAGLGLENKWNEVFFLTCLLAALLITSQRKLLASKWFRIGLALLVVLILPSGRDYLGPWADGNAGSGMRQFTR